MNVRLTDVLGVLCLVVYLPPASGAIARDIDRRTEELKEVEAAAQDPAALNDPALAKQIAELKASIAAGERAGADLWAQIKEEEQQKAASEKEKQALLEANQRLERTQIVLGSGSACPHRDANARDRRPAKEKYSQLEASSMLAAEIPSAD